MPVGRRSLGGYSVGHNRQNNYIQLLLKSWVKSMIDFLVFLDALASLRSMLECVQSVYRVCSGYVQGMFTVGCQD